MSIRNCGVSVSAADGMFAAYGTLSSSSCSLRHHAVSQRAAWVLVLRPLLPLNYRLSDAASAHVAPKNGGASVSAAAGLFAAYDKLGSSLALWHHAQMLSSAVALRAAWCEDMWR